MILGVGSAALVLFVMLFVLIVVGCMCIAWDPLVGVALMGGGLICGGLGILFMMLTVAMGGIATPAICKWVAGLFKKKAEKKELPPADSAEAPLIKEDKGTKQYKKK